MTGVSKAGFQKIILQPTRAALFLVVLDGIEKNLFCQLPGLRRILLLSLMVCTATAPCGSMVNFLAGGPMDIVCFVMISPATLRKVQPSMYCLCALTIASSRIQDGIPAPGSIVM